MEKELKMQRKRFYSLDSLRGIGAFAVVWGHIGGNTGDKYSVVLDFFFILSGFVIAHSYFWKPKTSFKDFLLIRFVRMYPLHIATMLLMLVYEIYVQPEHKATLKEIVVHVLFIQNMGFGPFELVLNLPSWSISPEFWINIVVYALLLLMLKNLSLRKYSRSILILSSLIISLVGYVFLALHSGSLDVWGVNNYGYLNLGLLRCTCGFLLGMCVYAVYDKYLLTWKPFKNAIIPFLILLIYVTFAYVPFEATLWDYIAIPFFALMILYLAKDHSKFSEKLGKLSFFGDISFSIYLLHWPLFIFSLHFQDLGISDALMRTILITSTFILSVICYTFFEIPTYKYFRAKILAKSKSLNTSKVSLKEVSGE